MEFVNNRLCSLGTRRSTSWKSDAPSKVVDGCFEYISRNSKFQLRARPAAPSMRLIDVDAALTHLIQSRQNIDDARGELDPSTIQQFNTDVLGLWYRINIESRGM